MKSALLSWQFWALLSAGFAAITAIFAKIGVENVNSDYATLIRTIVILFAVGAIVVGFGQWQPFGSVSARTSRVIGYNGLTSTILPVRELSSMRNLSPWRRPV
jgi:transporter family protein